MLFRTISIAFVMLVGLAVAGGNRSSENQGSGGDAGGQTGSDTTTIIGTVNSVSPGDSMIIIQSQQGMDTVYYNQNTQFTMGSQKVLRPNSQIKVKYIKEADRKIATRIQPASTDGSGASDTGDMGRNQDTTGKGIYPDTTEGSRSQDTGTGGGQDTGSGMGQDTSGGQGR